MAGPEQFDFVAFGASLQGLSREEQRTQVREELARARAMVVREPTWKFKQQIYVRRLERLARHLAGEEVAHESTPTEIDAYALLSGPPVPPARAAAAAAGPAPVSKASTSPPPVQPAPPALPAELPEAPSGDAADRRRSKRIQMKTRVLIRRESDGTPEMLEPVNVSRGGIAFRSTRVYALHEKILVNMHYQPNQPAGAGIETRSMIVRAVPIPNAQAFSYGVKFLD